MRILIDRIKKYFQRANTPKAVKPHPLQETLDAIAKTRGILAEMALKERQSAEANQALLLAGEAAAKALRDKNFSRFLKEATPAEKSQALLNETGKHLRDCNVQKALDLIRSGALLDERDAYLYTALIRSAIQGHTAIAAALLERGADIDCRNKHGFTALACAQQEKNSDIVRLIETAQQRRAVVAREKAVADEKNAVLADREALKRLRRELDALQEKHAKLRAEFDALAKKPETPPPASEEKSLRPPSTCQ